MKKRVLSLLLALVMVLSVFPMTVFADGEGTEPTELTEAVEPAETTEENEEPAEETEPVEEIPEEEEEEFTESAPAMNGDEVPTGAVAYVTDKDGNAIDADGEGSDDLGDGYYKTLQAAINACPTDGKQATITMLANERIFDLGKNVCWTISNGQDIVLDLNGFTIASLIAKDSQSHVIYVNSGAKLTVVDTSESETGMITNLDIGLAQVGEWWLEAPDGTKMANYVTNVITNKGTFTMNSGTLKSNGQGSICYAVDSQTGSTFNMNGGLLWDDFGTAVRLYHNGGKVDFTMTGGQIGFENGGDSGISVQVDGTNSSGTLTISGGTIYSNDYFALFSNSKADAITWNISGGTFITTKGTGGSGIGACCGTVNITGGRFICAKNVITKYSGVKSVSISGGYFSGDVQPYCAEGKYCVKNTHTVDQFSTDKEIDGTPVDVTAATTGLKYTIGEEAPDVCKIVSEDGQTETMYKSFNSALDVVKTGETIQLLDDAEGTGTHYVGYYSPYTNGFTVDLNGKTLDVEGYVFYIYDSSSQDTDYYKFNNLTFKNGTLNLNDSWAVYPYYGAYYAENGALNLGFENIEVNCNAESAITVSGQGYIYNLNLNLNNATIKSDAEEPVILYPSTITVNCAEGSNNYITTTNSSGEALVGGSSSTMTITGEGALYVDSPYVGINVGKLKNDKDNLYVTGTYPVYASTGELKAGFYSANVDDYCADGYVCVFNTNEETKEVYPYTVKKADDLTEEDYVATVTTPGSEPVYYTTLPAAIAEAYDGDTVTLLKDTVIDGGYVTISSDIVLDLDGHTVTNKSENGFYVYYSDVTVKNGTVTGADGAFYAYKGTLELDDVNATSTNGTAVIVDAATLTAPEGAKNTIIAKEDGILVNGTSTIEGTGELVVEGEQSAVHAYGYKLNSGSGYSAELTVTNPNLFATNSKTSGANNTRALYLSIEKGSGTTAKAVLYAGVYENDVEAYCAEDHGIVKLINGIDDEKNYKNYYQVTKRSLKLNQEEITEQDGTYKLGEEEIEVKVPENVEAEKVIEKINEMLDNETVAKYMDTNIEKATQQSTSKIKEELQKEVTNNIGENEGQYSEENAEEIKNNIGSAIDLKEKVYVDLSSVTVEEQNTETKTLMVTESEYEVKPMVTVVVTDAEGESVTVKAVIPNEAIKAPIRFLIPIDQSVTAPQIEMFHREKLTDNKQSVGVFPVIEDENGKHVELAAMEFSFYSYITMDVSEDAVAVIKTEDAEGNISYVGYNSLQEAATAFNVEENKTKEIILLKDVEETVDFVSKTLTLDLNGYVFKGASTNATGVTVKNTVKPGESIDTLAATGTYENNVSAFVADGYDVKTTTVTNDTVFLPTNADYTVIVEATPASGTADRDTTTVEYTWTVDGKDGTYSTEKAALEAAENDATKVHKNAWLDLYSGDKINVTVRVEGARFAAADVTLTFDPNNFKVTAPKTGWTAVKEDGQTIGYRFYDYYQGNDKYYENGEVLGEFKFTVLDGDSEKLNEAIRVSTSDTYVAKAWKDGWDSNPAGKLGANQLKDEYVNIRLKQMTASVTPNTGLVYKEIDQKLLADGYTAKDNLSEAAIIDATITYAVLTKAEVEGTAFVDEDENGFDDVYTNKGESTVNPGYVEGMEPKVPAEGNYGNSMMKTDAGDYVVFWKISKLGYVTVTGQENVSIAPLDVKLDWTMPKDVADPATGTIKATTAGEKDGLEQLITADFWGRYTADGYEFENTTEMNLNAGTEKPTYSDKNMHADVKALNKYRTPSIVMTEWPETATEGADLKKVGTYKFKADLGPNYHILNDEIEVLIDGGVISGYDLGPTSETTTGTSNDHFVYFDGNDHVAAKLVVEDDANPVTENVTKKYRFSSDDGENWSNWQDEIPSFTAANAIPYRIQMQLSAENYYTAVKEYEFSVKPVIYYTEKSDYVTGWDLVLCYTDEEVPSFNYDGKQMFDVSAFGYKLNSAWSDESGKTQTVEGTAYKHVYGIVVEGNADVNLVLPSNTLLYTKTNNNLVGGHVEHIIELSAKGRMDVNYSDSIDINDLVAVAATYNVDNSYLKSTDESIIAIVLRADVNGNKIVNTYDCSLIKTNTGK